MATDFHRLTSNGRVQALRELARGDSAPDPRFDRIARIAAHALGVTVSLVTFIDDERQYFRGCVGIPEPLATERQSPLSHFICQHVARSREPLLVSDARDDPALRDNGPVREWGVVSYAGVPLVTHDEHTVGSLCVIGFEPRQWTGDDVAALRDLAALAMEEFEGRVRAQASERGRDALAQSLARFRSTVEGLGEGVALIGLDGTIDYVSPRLLEMTGFEWSDLVGRSFAETLLSGDSPGEVRARLERRVLGESERYRCNLRRADDSLMAVEVGGAPLLDAGGAVIGSVETFADVTWRLYQEEVLRESEERFRAVFEHAGVGIALLGPGGTILDANPALVQLTRRAVSDLLSRGMDEIVNGAHRMKARTLYSQAIASESAVREEIALVAGDGSTVWSRVVATPLVLESGHDLPLVLVLVEDVTAERAAEEALREKALILDIVSDAVLEVDQGSRVLSWSAGAERLFGRTAAEMVGESAASALSQESRPRMQHEIIPAVTRDGRWAGEIEVVRADGERRTVDLSVVLRRDAEGRPVSQIAVGRDVTERKRADEALRRSEQLLRQAQGIARIGTWVWHVAEGVLEWSDETFRIFGFEPEERKSTFEFYLSQLHPDDRAEVEARIVEAVRAGGPFEYESRVLPADGVARYHQVRGVLSLDEVGNPARGIGVVQDITAWKEVEAELRQQALVFTTIEDAVVITDAAGCILDCNPAAARFRGLPREEMLGRDAGLVIGAPEAARDEVWRVLEAVGGWSGTLDYRLPEGRSGVIEGAAVLQRDEQGRRTGVIIVYRDITERHALENRLRHAQKMEAVGRLAGGIAHDFNNILMAVGGFARLLHARVPAGTTEHTWLDEIRRGTERAAALTSQLLAFSRKQVLRPEVLDVSRVAHEMLPLLARLMGEQVQIETRLAAGLPEVRVDRGQLDQVIMNLGINARDAMPRGGRLVISTDLAHIGPGSTLRLPPGTYGRLSVRDSGEGIAPDVIEHIFEPFYTTKPQGKGTGLGLSTVEGILDQSGGAIEVESRPGEGATFRVYLPLAHGAAAVAPAGAADEARGGPRTILLVEDDPAVLALARVVLEGEGFRVLFATRGTEALEIAASHAGRIDLLLSDVMMPGMSGPQLARLLRERAPELRVGLISGYTGDTMPEGLTTGFELAHKPIGPDELVRWVRSLLEGG